MPSDLLKQIDSFLNSPTGDGKPRPVTLGAEIDRLLAAESPTSPKAGTKRGRVKRVVDGDTLDVEGIGRVRMLGLDTPEVYGKVEKGGPRASRFLSHLAEGKDVDVEIGPEPEDKYGRKLAHVYTEEGQVSLAAEMLDSGLADAYPGSKAARLPSKVKVGEAASAAVTGTLAGMVKGLIYPVSAFVPSYYKRLDEQILESRSTMSKYLQAKEIGDESTRQLLTATPGLVGEIAGGLIPGLGAYGAARTAFGVGKAATMGAKAIKTIAAGAAAGGATSAFAYLEDGESRFAHVAYTTALGGAFETLGLPLMRRAWREELKEKAADGITKTVATRLGLEPDAASDVITAVRTGLLPKDEAVARTIVETIRTEHPEAIGSTVDIQAKKILDTWVTRILPENPPTAEPGLRQMNPNFGVGFDVVVGDQKFPMRIPSNPKNVGDFSEKLGKLRQRLYEITSQESQPIRLDNFRFHSQASYNRFVNFLYGREGSGAPALRQIPGSAPEATIAYSGDVPEVGSKVTFIPTGKQVTILPRNVQAPLEAPPESPGTGAGGSPVTTQRDPLEKANLPSPGMTEPEKALYTRSSVYVQDDTGKTIKVKLSELRPYVDLARPGKPVLSQFKPHQDGLTRHGFIDLQNGKVNLEPVNDTTQPWFRDKLFFQQDPDSQIVNMPRLFLHPGDQATIAVAPVERFRMEPQFGRSLEAGPKDSVAARQHTPYQETQLQAADAYARHGNAVRSDVRPGKDRLYVRKDWTPAGADAVATSRFGAGFSPAKTRANSVSEFGRTEAEELLPPVSRGKPFLSKQGQPQELAYFGESRQLTPEHLSDPALVTARDSARLLLKKGMSPSTKINVRVTPYSYSYAPEEQAAFTLRDLADVEFSLTDLSVLQEEASVRGFRAIPKGRGIVLEATDGSYKKEFSQQLEAAEALGRIPIGRYGPKIERDLERQWGYGFERSFDADVDSDIFRPVEFQQASLHEVLQGKRPLASVWTGNENNLAQAVEQLAKTLRLDPSSFNLMQVGEDLARGRKHIAIYNRTATQQAVNKFAPALRFLGVEAEGKPLPAVLGELATRKHGLAFLYGGGRDPMDSILYTYLRERGEKELWSKAEVAVDSMGPYRKFSESIRQTVKQRNLTGRGVGGAEPSPGGGVQPPLSSPVDMPGAGGPVDGEWTDLADQINLPRDFYFTPRDFDGPPPMAEDFNPPIGDTSGPVSKLINRFRIPQELFKHLEEATGVPFYHWFRALEEGRAGVEAHTKEAFGNLAKLSRGFTSEDRKRVQMLVESKYGASPEEYAALSRSVAPKVREAADLTDGYYKKYLGDLGYSNTDVEEFLGHFPKVRLAPHGDYKVWVRGRANLPKPMVDMHDAFATGEINLDERDLDFHTLGRRVFRAAANAKFLRQPWDDVDEALKAYSHSRSSTELTNYFKFFDSYRREAMHLPDGMATSLGNAMNQTWEKLFGKRLPEDEMIDFVSTLTSFNYYANMAFQVGMVGRNYLQTLQTTYPAIGAKHTAEGIRWALKWRKDTALQKEMLEKGVVARDAYIEPLRDVQRLLVQSKAAEKLGSAPQKLMDVLDYGVKWYQSADNFNRVVAYRAQYTKAKEAADEFLAGKIDWDKFTNKSGMEFRDGQNGPMMKTVRELLSERGNAEAAANYMAVDFARASQFVYTRGNVPYAMQSTLGRFFGQYGTWPAYYVEQLGHSLQRSSNRGRAEYLGRWVAANTAIYGGLGYAFGADFARWTFLAPTSYMGGPFAQLTLDAGKLYQAQVTGEEDPVAQITKSRWMGNPNDPMWQRIVQSAPVRQVTPLPMGAARNYWQAVDSLSKENYGDFVRRTLGLPKDE